MDVMKHKEALKNLRDAFEEVLVKQPEVFTVKTIGYILWRMEDEPKDIVRLQKQMLKVLKNLIYSDNISANAIETIQSQISEEIWDDAELPVRLMNDEEKAQKLSKKTMKFLDAFLQVVQPQEK